MRAGIDGGDAEAEAHGAVGGRAAALAKDGLLPRKANDVIDGEEVARVIELGDQRQLLGNQRPHIFRNAVGVAFARQMPGQLFQVALRRLSGRNRLVGVFVAQFFKIEGDAFYDLHGASDGLRVGREEALHLGSGLEMPLGIAFKAEACVGNRAFLTNADQYVGQRLAKGMVIECIGSGEQLRTALTGQLEQGRPDGAARLPR